ncbi:MAG: hypothetical protein OXE94_00685 [Aestuariivita sp.]|nr:hypothetical protein [Aestuariivita sp.]MCY4202633.1 hypothetical protein [Aestuariivita sp.]MCY4289535.1 hypothetical protein [Aestuariivita sp.]
MIGFQRWVRVGLGQTDRLESTFRIPAMAVVIRGGAGERPRDSIGENTGTLKRRFRPAFPASINVSQSGLSR